MKTTKKLYALNIVLWIVQLLLSITLLYAAWMKLFADREALALMWPWTAGSPRLVTITGIFDAMAGLGMIIPGIFRLSHRWTAAAGAATVLLMICAIVFHLSRGEAEVIGFNLVVALMAVFVAWGRFRQP